MTRLLVGVSLLLAAITSARAQLDWGINRQIVSGGLGQYGIGADRTPGPDTVFLGVIRSANGGDTLQLYRTIDRGESWSLVWQGPQVNERLTDLSVRVGTGNEDWVYMFWISDDGHNNGDIRGVRVSFDGIIWQNLYPTLPGAPDTLRWLTATRGFAPDYRLYVFYQDEAGLVGADRAPVIRYCASTDYGLSWTPSRLLVTGFETPAADYGAPGCIYVACRSIAQQDIELIATSNEGDSWRTRWVTDDTIYNNDMFPSVATTHDSVHGALAWVTYDSYRHDNLSWSVYCAYTADGGLTWTLDQAVASGNRNQFWSDIECAGHGSRQTRVVYLSDLDQPHGYRVCYRTGTAANPAQWSSALALSDQNPDISMAPAVANYGTTWDGANQGLVFYAEPGPTNVWYNAWQFGGISEPKPNPGIERLSARIVGGAIQAEFELPEPGDVAIALYDAGGRRVYRVRAQPLMPGAHTLTLSIPSLAAGVYLLRLTEGTHEAACKIILYR